MRPLKATETPGKWLGPAGRAAALAAALMLPGCPDDKPHSCGGPAPAFSVTLMASDGPLPQDSVFLVKHGTGTEEFRLDAPFPRSDVVFCCHATRNGECVDAFDAGGLDAGSGSPPVEGAACELWTDGAARITVVASGYPVLDQNLEAKSNAGCIETVDVKLTLEREDSGP